MSNLQQSLSELQALFDAPGGSRDEVSKRITKLKLELAQSGLLFARADADPQDLLATRSILEIAAFHSLRLGNLKPYRQYNASLFSFYSDLSSILPSSPNRPVMIGLHLSDLLALGRLTEFHTVLETLKTEELNDVFIKWPVDLERWLMEGAYNKVYKARERVPREEYGVVLENLMATLRLQIAQTVEASYPSLPLQSASALLFFSSGEIQQLIDFATSRGWSLQPTTQTFTFPSSAEAQALAAEATNTPSASAVIGKGVERGVPMLNMVAPALTMARQLEAIV